MSSPGLRLTKGGKEILAKGLTGKVIEFTRVAYGSGEFDYDTEKVYDLEEMREWKMDLPIVGKKIEGNGLVNILAQLNNYNLEKGFAAREIGVYARDPDSGEEILYAYCNEGDEYTFIPSKSGAHHKDTTMGFLVAIEDADNITFNIDYQFAHVTITDFQRHIESSHPHPNVPNVAAQAEVPSELATDTTVVNAFWVTGDDGELKKMTIDDVKRLITEDLEKRIDESEPDYANIEDLKERTANLEDKMGDISSLLNDFVPSNENKSGERGLVPAPPATNEIIVLTNQGWRKFTAADMLISELPSIAAELTYNRQAQTPQWNNYDPLKLIIGGDYKDLTEAGTYYASFTPSGDLTWSDNTRTTRFVESSRRKSRCRV